ncbi:MAG: S41 family peptidase [Gemmatirosa sp.]
MSTPVPPPPSRRAARRRRAAVVVLGAAGLAGVALTATAARAPAPEGAMLEQVMQLVADRHLRQDTAALDVYAATARGLVRELEDPYSVLLAPKDLESFNRSMLGQYAGIGVEVNAIGDRTIVGEVYAGGPSAAAGLRRGDRIVQVEGQSVVGFSLDSVVARIRGTPGTPVRVSIARGAAEPVEMQLTRAVVHVPAVPYAFVDRGVGYLPLPSVTGTAGQDVADAVARLRRAGARSIVLDVRGNPGGAVPEAVRVVGQFLPPGSAALDVRERTGISTIRTRGPGTQRDLPIVVLQDGRSASAAEIIAGALQDHDRALVVGTRSFGKGLAQGVFPVQGGYALKLTTARWHTPSGRSIHRDRTAADSAWRGTSDGKVAGDSLHRSLGGRPLIGGGGGIVPDVVVQGDTLTTVEQRVARQLARGARSADVLQRLTYELAQGADSAFRVTPAWRDRFHRELASAGVSIDAADWAGAAPYVTRLLEGRVAEFAFGRAESRRRALADDRQYIVADSVLRVGGMPRTRS